MMHQKLVEFVRDTYKTQEFIPLHAPTFNGNEKAYVLNTIESTFVSSVGKYVEDFELAIADYTGSAKAVAVVNGTAALHTALYMAGVRANDMVITQALTFVATCNALFHMGVEPIFADVSKTTLGLCPKSVEQFLEQNATIDDNGQCIDKTSGKVIRAVVPMHTFGHPVELDELMAVCEKWHLTLVEDAAESLGSFYKGKHTGTMGQYAALSFNGNKIITTGGGGMVLCRDLKQGEHTKHVTTTAKRPHPFEFYHDEPGFNYRLPNLNAALGCAQMEVLAEFVEKKRALAHHYEQFFAGSDFTFVKEPEHCQSNYWLNAIMCPDVDARNQMLEQCNQAGVMVRPIWQLMHRLPMFSHCRRTDLSNSEVIESLLVNIPSTPVSI